MLKGALLRYIGIFPDLGKGSFGRLNFSEWGFSRAC